jgi:hypothetical protein
MYDGMECHLLEHKFVGYEPEKKMGWFHCVIYYYLSTMLQDVPIPDSPYKFHGFVIHAWRRGVEDELI